MQNLLLRPSQVKITRPKNWREERFDFSLSFGHDCENYVIDLFNNQKIECKGMKSFGKNCRIFIEIESRGKPSGIITTEALWLAIVFDGVFKRNQIIFRTVESVREMIQVYRKDAFYGGDEKTSLLVPIPLSYFTGYEFIKAGA